MTREYLLIFYRGGAAFTETVQATALPPWYVNKHVLVIDYDLRKVKTSHQYFSMFIRAYNLKETSLLFVGKSYPRFLFLFLFNSKCVL